MKSKSLFSGFIFVIIVVIGLVWARSVYSTTNITESAVIAGGAFIIALVFFSATGDKKFRIKIICNAISKA